MQHQRHCKVNSILQDQSNINNDTVNLNTNQNSQDELQNNDANTGQSNDTRDGETFYWASVKGSYINAIIDKVYDKIVFWRKNLFLLPKWCCWQKLHS